VNAILLDAGGHEVEPRTVVPRRVRLSRAAVDRFAGLTGVPSPAEQMLTAGSSLDGLGERLGEVVRGVESPGAPAAGVSDVGEVLVAAGLVEDGVPTEQGRAVLTVWHAPALAVEIELLVCLARGQVRARSWHRNLDDWVVCLSTGDGEVFELSWLAAEDWWLELGRAAHVDPRTLLPAPDAEPVPDVIETPWELLLTTGEAVQRRRRDLLDQLVADHSGTTIAGDGPDSLATADDRDVRRWHEQLESASRGRLHAAVMGRDGRGRPGAGIVEWVLLHDGWRALTPFTRDGWTMVRIERTGPVDLARALAVRAAGVTS